jgi:hypothetical protein
MTIKTIIQIEAPVSKVFSSLTDGKNLKNWQEGFKKLKSISGRRPNKGSISKQVFEDAKGFMEVEEEILYYDRNKEFQVKLSHKNMLTMETYEFVNQGDSTRLILTTNIRLIPMFIGIFAPFMKPQMRNLQEANLRRLKRLLEK